MLLASHLRRSRHGIFYFRIVLPDPIAAVLGQRELVRSLGIRSPKLARQSGYQLSLQITPILEGLQRIMAIDPNSINPNDVRKLVVEGLDFRADGGMSVQRVKTHDDPKVAELEMQTIRDTAKAWRSVHDFTAGLSDDEFAKRKLEAARLRDEMLAMAAAPTQAAPPAPAASTGISIPLRPSTLRQTYDAYMATKRKIAESTKTAYKGSFDLFATLCGGEGRMIHEITEKEFVEFNDALPFVPAHATKRGIQLKRAAEMIANPPVGKDKNDNPVEYDSISGNTANLHCTNLQGFIDYATSSGRRNGDNPFLRMTRHSDGEEIGGADGFDEHELRDIFNPESLMQAKRPSQFWAPLLALYTGARLNELACLELSDFVQEKGIPCISIRYIPRAKPGTIEHTKKKKGAARSVKTGSSIRLVPLHPDLYEIGIEAYMDDVRAIGAERFFPTLPPDTKGKRERRLSHDGNEYLKKVGVHVPRNKVMHSFRDTVCEMLAVPDMDDVRADQWTGHATQTVKGRHYRRSKAAIQLQAKEGFGALQFPFIDLDALQYRLGWFNDYNRANMVP